MSLPEEKKERLAEKVKEGIFREVKRNYKDLRDHDVSSEDAFDVIRRSHVVVNHDDLEKE